MARELRFDNLSASEFEGLCFDLLSGLGPENAVWRKGTPGPTSPADQGRDIECIFRYRAPGNDWLQERRFVECKHHSKGVPPRELEAALSWAAAERPDTLHFIVSGFLSNGAKEY